jgi:hypothetical protein
MASQQTVADGTAPSAGPVATRSTFGPQASAGFVPTHATGRVEPIESTAFDVVDVRLHRPLCDDGGVTRF